jgi:PAS domain S-box-containing protein
MKNKEPSKSELLQEIDKLKKQNAKLKRSQKQQFINREDQSQQQTFLHNVIESLTHPFYVINVKDYSIEMANKATGLEDSPKLLTCYAVTHHRETPCDTKEHICPLREVIQFKKPFKVEHIHYVNGSHRYFEVHGYPIFDDNGKVIQMIEYSLDITQRKIIEKELKTALKEALNRRNEVSALLEASQMVLEKEKTEIKSTARNIFEICKKIVHAGSGCIAFISADKDAKEVLYSYSEDSASDQKTQLKVLSFALQGMEQKALESQKAIFENNFQEIMENNGQVKNSEFQGIKNILIAPLVIRDLSLGLLCLWDKEGGFNDNDLKISLAFGELIAIALQNFNTLKELEDSENRYRTVIETASDGIITIDQNSLIKSWNKGAKKIFGFKEKEILDQHLSLLMPDEYKNLRIESIKDLIKGRQAKILGKTIEIKGKRKNNSIFPLELSIASWSTDKHTFFTGIVRDITERIKFNEALKEAKLKAEESDRLKSAFLANMSHEIRTPMNAIVGYTDLLLKEELRSEQKNYLDIIKDSGSLLLSIINDILDLSKIQAGEMKVERIPLNLNAVFSQLMSMGKIIIEQNRKNIELRQYLPANFNPFILGDQTRLMQVMTNLISNAIKFTEHGFIEFGLSLKDEKTMEFYVRDTGIGIKKDKMSVIFNPFQQGDVSTTRKHGGTGLGLTIVKRLIELMHGEISVKSSTKKDHGSSFYFTLAFSPAAKIKNSHPQTREKISGEVKILLVEDNEVNLFLTEKILTNAGFKVAKAMDGREAISIFKGSKDIRLILMDVHMPVLNGLDATKVIRNLEKKENINQQIPIIALTAGAMDEDKLNCLEAGCDDFLSKPINQDSLIQSIHKHLAHQSQNK